MLELFPQVLKITAVVTIIKYHSNRYDRYITVVMVVIIVNHVWLSSTPLYCNNSILNH